MKLPFRINAVVREEKVRDYLLSNEHPVGRFKAAFFRALGYARSDWPRLRSDLLGHGRRGVVVSETESPFGTKYEVRGRIRGPNGREGNVVSIWMIRRGESSPRLVTAYPGETS